MMDFSLSDVIPQFTASSASTNDRKSYNGLFHPYNNPHQYEPHNGRPCATTNLIEIESYLREFSRIPPPLDLVLQNIAGLRREHGRLPGSTEVAVAIAIWSSPEKRLTLQGIYDAIENAFPDLRDMSDKPWKRTIRHTLSLKGLFVAVRRAAYGRGKYWELNIKHGGTEKRQRKRGPNRGPDMRSVKATSPESQISDLDHSCSNLWLDSLHTLEDGTDFFLSDPWETFCNKELNESQLLLQPPQNEGPTSFNDFNFDLFQIQDVIFSMPFAFDP